MTNKHTALQKLASPVTQLVDTAFTSNIVKVTAEAYHEDELMTLFQQRSPV